jgi:TetR/AcrR family transcriptional repressor of nem operon
MKKLDLTHGGFYAHFENKEDLVRESISRAFDEVDERLEEVLEQHGVAGLIQLYLSPEHVGNTGLGCPVPALAAEVTRQHGVSASLFSERLIRRIEMFADKLQGESAGERLDRATFIFSSLVGAVTLARSTTDPVERQKILESTRSRLLNSI